MKRINEALKDYIIGLAHIGHIVRDLENGIAGFRRLYGLSDDDITILDAPAGTPQLTRFAFIRVGETEFELIEPVSEHFKTILLGMPSGLGGINHVAYLVDDIEGAVKCLAAQDIFPGHVTPDGIVDMGRKKMVYLDPDTTGGLVVELIENVSPET